MNIIYNAKCPLSVMEMCLDAYTHGLRIDEISEEYRVIYKDYLEIRNAEKSKED